MNYSNDDQAFPKGQDAEHGNSGMTLLHYFMAHAPVTVPEEFYFEGCPKLPADYFLATPEENRTGKWDELHEQRRAHILERRLQWPRYWAEEQIKRAN